METTTDDGEPIRHAPPSIASPPPPRQDEDGTTRGNDRERTMATNHDRGDDVEPSKRHDPRVWVGYGSKKQKTHWPAAVVLPENVPIPLQEHAKPGKVCVMFYGPPKNKSHVREYGWYKPKGLLPFQDNLQRFQEQKASKTNAACLKLAIQEAVRDNERVDDGHPSTGSLPVDSPSIPAAAIPPPPPFPPVEPPAKAAAWIEAALKGTLAAVKSEPAPCNGGATLDGVSGDDGMHRGPSGVKVSPRCKEAVRHDGTRSVSCSYSGGNGAEASTSQRLGVLEQYQAMVPRKHLSLNSIVGSLAGNGIDSAEPCKALGTLCESCERVPRKGKSKYCTTCQRARKAGRVCCGCDRTYEPEDDNMIQCDVCDKWVHNGCCALAREIMSLPPDVRETAHYTCARCDHRAKDSKLLLGPKNKKRFEKSGRVAPSVQRVSVAVPVDGRRSSKLSGLESTPSPRPPAEGPCRVCAKHCVHGTPDVISCSECLQLVHGACTGLGTRSRPFVAGSIGAETYLCPCCVKAIGTLKRKAEDKQDDDVLLKRRCLQSQHGKETYRQQTKKRRGEKRKARADAPAVIGGIKSSDRKASKSKLKSELNCRICGRGQFTGYKVMVRCDGCHGHVHSKCDEHAKTVLKRRKKKSRKERYYCPECIACQVPTLKRKASTKCKEEQTTDPSPKARKRKKPKQRVLPLSKKKSLPSEDQASLKQAPSGSGQSKLAPKVAKSSSDAPSKKDIENAEKERGRLDHKPDGAPTLLSSKVAFLPGKKTFDLKTALNFGAPRPPLKHKSKYSILADLKGLPSAKEAKMQWEALTDEDLQRVKDAEARDLREHERLHAEYLQEMEVWKEASIMTGMLPFTSANGTLKGGDLLLVLEQALLEYVKKNKDHTAPSTSLTPACHGASKGTDPSFSGSELGGKTGKAPLKKKEPQEAGKDVPEQVPVTCGQLSGILLTGSMRIISDGKEMSAREFEVLAGLGAAKKWKFSIKTTDGKKVGDLLVRLGLSTPPQQRGSRIAPVPLSMTDTGSKFAPPSVYAPWHETSVPSFSPIAAHWAGDRCAVCQEDREYDVDQLVSCDDCRVTVHQSCYGIARAPGPDETWLCEACVHYRRMGRAARKVEQLLEQIHSDSGSTKRLQAEKFMDEQAENSSSASQTAVDKSWRNLERLSWKRLGSIIDYATPLVRMVSDETRTLFANAFKAQAGLLLRRPQCCLCPVSGGALKRTEVPGVWAHWSCGMYIAENYIENIARMEPICGIKSIAKDRWDLPCTLCRKRVGAKIQCASACYTSYHTTCARMSGQRFEAKTSNSKDPDAPLRLLSYCRKHGGTNLLNATPVRVEKESAHGLGWAAIAEDVGAKLHAMVLESTKVLAGFRTTAGAARCQPVDEEWQRESHGTGVASVSGDKAFWLPKITSPAPKQMKQKGGTGAKNLRSAHADRTPAKPDKALPRLPEGVLEVVPVCCLNMAGVLLVRACQIKTGGGSIMSPSDFERLAGAGRAKKWRNSLKVGRFDEKSAAIVEDVYACMDGDPDPEPSIEGHHVVSLYEQISSDSVLFSDGPDVNIGDYLGQRGLQAKLHADFKADWTRREYWILLELGLLEEALGRHEDLVDSGTCSDPGSNGQVPNGGLVSVSICVNPSHWVNRQLVNVTLSIVSPCKDRSIDNTPTDILLTSPEQEVAEDAGYQVNGDSLPNHISAIAEPEERLDDVCTDVQTEGTMSPALLVRQEPQSNGDMHESGPGYDANLSLNSTIATIDPEAHADAGCVLPSTDVLLRGNLEVGRYLRVYWSEDDEWFAGRILAYLEKENEYQIEYELDGEVEQLDLSQEKYEWLSNLSPGKGNDLIGWKVAVYWHDDNCTYDGVVVDYHENVDMHTVYYDDGDVEQICLGAEAVQFVEKVGVTENVRIAVQEKDKCYGGFNGLNVIQVKCGERIGKFDAILQRITCDGQDFSPVDFETYSGNQDPRGWKYSIKVRSNDSRLSTTIGEWLEQHFSKKKPDDALDARFGVLAHSQENKLDAERGGVQEHNVGYKAGGNTAANQPGLFGEPAVPKPKEQKQQAAGKRFGKRLYVYALEQLPRGLGSHFPEQLPPSKLWPSEAWALKSASENLLSSVQNKDQEHLVHGRPLMLLKQKLEYLAQTEMCRVAFGKSGIHGWGLIARTPIKKDDMVIEYRGVVIRSVLADLHESRHRKARKDCYLFSVDSGIVVDATDCGSPSRFINHCCNPSLYTRVLEVDSIGRLVFFARKNIKVGEELTFDYRFEKEDEESKIPCYCGAPNCRGTMN
uniref:Histone-lysine N-methyltransferase n=1 Tax=Picocystis salinarum TaxID=88271 RepID=A0A7S3UA97_9CHLO